MTRGWCPDAYRPMRSGDGLIVRLRPRLGRLTASEILAVCAAAARHGSGVLELTRRANLQLRGVTDHQALLAALPEGLVDPDPAIEARRNILVEPLWHPGDATFAIARELAARLAELPDLPAKFGFAVDAGPAPVLRHAPADVRIERGRTGLIVRADGAGLGAPTTAARAADGAIALARWFAETGGSTRMARHVARLRPPGSVPLAPAAAPLAPGPTPLGPVLGVPFGQVAAAALVRLVRDSGTAAVRLTPWRLVLLEGGRITAAPGFVTAPGDPLLAADACPGAPFCAAASVETRALARALAPRLASLHVSGCAKGCARSRPAALTLVGRDGRFDLVHHGRAGDPPAETGLAPEAILDRYGLTDAPV